MKKKADQQSSYRVMAEYASSGIWLIKQQGVFRHSGVSWSYLKLPTALSDQFSTWIDYYNSKLNFNNTDNFDVEAFNEEGLRLATELKRFLGDRSSVEFQGELESGGLLDPVPIEVA